MQRGSLIRSTRKQGPDVWQFRWSEKGGNGKRVYRKRVIGTVDQCSDAIEVWRIAAAMIAAPKDRFVDPAAMTVAQLALHFRHHELAQDDGWRSYSTRRNYEFYLDRWVTPRWGGFKLSDVRTIEVESWLRTLPLAKQLRENSKPDVGAV